MKYALINHPFRSESQKGFSKNDFPNDWKNLLIRLELLRLLLNDTLFVFLGREVTVASKLLKNIQRYSGDIKDMTLGKTLATNSPLTMQINPLWLHS